MDNNEEIAIEILKYLAFYTFPEWQNLAIIQERVLPEKELDYGTIRRNLESLKEQGFIDVKDINDDNTLRARITLKGKNKIMNKLEEIKYKILKYLNEHHVRQNSNLTEEAIRDYFYDIKGTTYYNTAFEELSNNKYIDKTSSSTQWQIQQSGIDLLNSINLEKNIEATTNNAEASKNLLDISKINMVATLALTIVLATISGFQCNEQSTQNDLIRIQNSIQHRQMQEEIKSNNNSMPIRIHDTIFIDSSKQ
ncbi:MAG: hypothetical protein NTX97_07415 [Bacteroidetes bacterium]|nr:hypothetical protein [Bacteroidota bacterium]